MAFIQLFHLTNKQIMNILTITPHASSQTLDEPAVLAPVPVTLLDLAVLNGVSLMHRPSSPPSPC